MCGQANSFCTKVPLFWAVRRKQPKKRNVGNGYSGPSGAQSRETSNRRVFLLNLKSPACQNQGCLKYSGESNLPTCNIQPVIPARPLKQKSSNAGDHIHRGGGGGGREGVENTFHGMRVCQNNCANGASGRRFPSAAPPRLPPCRRILAAASCLPITCIANANTSSNTSSPPPPPAPPPSPAPTPPGMRNRTLSFMKFGPINRGSSTFASCGRSANDSSKSESDRSRYLWMGEFSP